ncbi:MAG: hypothetical protein IAI50_17640 [Candidatus Eremiobacteraeota bacterium]|nr:hypothetical protein [Candidatus Eremiobacteraeota bacterium]
MWLRATLGCAALVAALAAGRTPSPAAVVHTPTTAVHTEFVVETNRLGQVTRVRSGVSSKDAAFNAMTYGNALQSFIRTDSGRAVAGTYRLDYDYDPRRKAVKRSVAIVRAGGVNPNAPGAVTVEERKLAKQSHTGAGAAASPGPLPDLKAITSPSH